MRECRHRYYKDQDPERPLVSALPLPKDPDGKVRNVHFIECTFHPNCDHKLFVDCKFTRCDGPKEE